MESDVKPGSVPCVYFKWEVVSQEVMGNDNGKGEEPGGRLGELCCLKKQSLRRNVGRKWKGTISRVEKQKMEREKEREESLRREEQF